MKSKSILKKRTVEDAVKALEQASWELVRKAQWSSPYNGFKVGARRTKSPINELRQPLLELRLARKLANSQ